MPGPETPSPEPGTLSDREFVRVIGEQVGAGVGAELATMRKQLDHIDEMLHQLTAFVDEHKPLLTRAANIGFGRGWREWQKGSSAKKSGLG